MCDILAWGRVRKIMRAVLLCGCAACVVFAVVLGVNHHRLDSYHADAPQEELREISFPSGDGRVNVNIADSEALQTLSGIGPGKAQAIIAEREANGPFRYPEELSQVKGIGVKTVEKLRDDICFE